MSYSPLNSSLRARIHLFHCYDNFGKHTSGRWPFSFCSTCVHAELLGNSSATAGNDKSQQDLSHLPGVEPFCYSHSLFRLSTIRCPSPLCDLLFPGAIPLLCLKSGQSALLFEARATLKIPDVSVVSILGTFLSRLSVKRFSFLFCSQGLAV